MNSTAVASIILGIITIVLSVLLGKKTGQKEVIEEQIEGVKAQLSASQKETQIAQENAVQAQKQASEAKSELSKANVIAQQKAAEFDVLDSVKDKIIEYIQHGAENDIAMKDLSSRLENAKERNDIEGAIEVARLQAERAVALGMSKAPSSDDGNEN